MAEERLWHIDSRDGPLLPSVSHAPQQCDFAAPYSERVVKLITVKLISLALESQLVLQLALAQSNVTKEVWCDF